MSHLPDHETLPSLPNCHGGSSHRSACCPWAKHLSVFVAVAALAAVAFVAGRWTNHNDVPSELANVDWEAMGLPPINAVATVTSEKYSMATGFVSEDVEGLFVLDHNSGLLQCNALYPRNPQLGFAGRYSINVADALGTGGKAGEYVMVTGVVDFPRASNRPAAGTVIYVMDTATGNYACYGIPFDRVAMNGNRPQQGTLVLIASGSANPIIDRDNLR